jgi:hypothetical protein
MHSGVYMGRAILVQQFINSMEHHRKPDFVWCVPQGAVQLWAAVAMQEPLRQSLSLDGL